jgi:hypothetical protein
MRWRSEQVSQLSDAEVHAYLKRTTRGVYVFHPMDFLGLTVEHPRVMRQIMGAPPSRSRPERDPPILIVRSLGGPVAEITGHDGRHRAWAALNAGLGFPVRILCKQPLARLPAFFQGQFDKGFFLPLASQGWLPPP